MTLSNTKGPRRTNDVTPYNWRRGRDSNPRNPLQGLTVFETAAFNRSATSPPLFLHDLAVLVQAGCDHFCDQSSLNSLGFGANMRLAESAIALRGYD